MLGSFIGLMEYPAQNYLMPVTFVSFCSTVYIEYRIKLSYHIQALLEYHSRRGSDCLLQCLLHVFNCVLVRSAHALCRKFMFQAPGLK